jgi:hypothetical protein
VLSSAIVSLLFHSLQKGFMEMWFGRKTALGLFSREQPVLRTGYFLRDCNLNILKQKKITQIMFQNLWIAWNPMK